MTLKVETKMVLPMAAVADACLRAGEPLRIAPSGLMPVAEGMSVAGPALPARHFGSVDVFLEAYENASPGDVLVIDNEARRDEGCIGDLTIIEAANAGLAGVLVYGCHRDTDELRRIGLPVFSYGRYPAGPREARVRTKDALVSARFGDVVVTRGDFVVADSDGAIFVSAKNRDVVLQEARIIFDRERKQADKVRAGTPLRSQLRFREYLAKRAKDPTHTFRDHIRGLGGEIEQ